MLVHHKEHWRPCCLNVLLSLLGSLACVPGSFLRPDLVDEAACIVVHLQKAGQVGGVQEVHLVSPSVLPLVGLPDDGGMVV